MLFTRINNFTDIEITNLGKLVLLSKKYHFCGELSYPVLASSCLTNWPHSHADLNYWFVIGHNL